MTHPELSRTYRPRKRPRWYAPHARPRLGYLVECQCGVHETRTTRPADHCGSGGWLCGATWRVAHLPRPAIAAAIRKH